ncbi:hypothetical protein [Diaminobutyricibacter sp. McL0608]|uniref:transmembrane-type terpene cyclase n=1 Tax=Leifsonia sp. McL0608 TaxID=3143537 RepID=UPI0031F31288
MDLLLTIVSGLAWTIVYIEAIRLGFRYKTYAIPVAALGLNFAWETIYGIHGLTETISAQSVINLVWAAADVVIVFTFIRFGRAELPRFVTRPLFIGWTLVVFGVAFAVQALFIGEFGWMGGARYSAFLQNLLMSGLFIAMLVARRGVRGQSMVIAVAKWLGTLAPTILFGALGGHVFILWIGLLCSVLDLIYIGLVWSAKKNPIAFAMPSDAAAQPVTAG